ASCGTSPAGGRAGIPRRQAGRSRYPQYGQTLGAGGRFAAGSDQAGSSLTADERVDRVTFTGPSTTGKLVMASTAAHLAPLSLELGGKGVSTVFDDANLDNAVDWSGKSPRPEVITNGTPTLLM